MSKFIYSWEDPNKNKLNDKSYSFFSKQMQDYSLKNQNLPNIEPTVNKTPIRKYITPNLTPINRVNNNNNDNNIKDNSINDNNNNNINNSSFNTNINKTIEKSSPKSQFNLPVQTDADFSHLLRLMTNNKNMRNTTNANNSIT
jgi:hypothetical protein